MHFPSLLVPERHGGEILVLYRLLLRWPTPLCPKREEGGFVMRKPSSPPPECHHGLSSLPWWREDVRRKEEEMGVSYELAHVPFYKPTRSRASPSPRRQPPRSTNLNPLHHQQRTESRPTSCAHPWRLAFCHGTHSRALHIRHQPYAMHAAYVAKTARVGELVEWQLPPHDVGHGRPMYHGINLPHDVLHDARENRKLTRVRVNEEARKISRRELPQAPILCT